MNRVFYILIILAVAASCETVKQTPSAVGYRPLASYTTQSTIATPDSVNFMFFTREDDFNKAFVLTKSTPAAMTVPDFNSQAVPAIILKASTSIRDVAIDKAELAGNEMHIYYTIANTSGTTYSQSAFALGTVPKAVDVKTVKFYTNNTLQKTVNIAF